MSIMLQCATITFNGRYTMDYHENWQKFISQHFNPTLISCRQLVVRKLATSRQKDYQSVIKILQIEFLPAAMHVSLSYIVHVDWPSTKVPTCSALDCPNIS